MSSASAQSPSTPRIERYDALASTNDTAARRAGQGERGPLWIVADRQTGGRGRQGRVWASPPGNLYASVLFSACGPAARRPELGFVAGVALAEAVAHVIGPSPRCVLKWPNDLTCGGAKLSGLLLESVTLPDGTSAVVAGFGVNCASHPTGLAYPATDLGMLAGRAVSPDDLLQALVETFTAALTQWDEGRGFASIRRRWLAAAMAPGAPILVDTGRARVAGRFSTIDPTGRLVVETDAGPCLVAAGDVHFHNDTGAIDRP